MKFGVLPVCVWWERDVRDGEPKRVWGEATGETGSPSCSHLGLTHKTVYVCRRSSQTGLQEICSVRKGFTIFPTNCGLQFGLGGFFHSRCWREVRTLRKLADLGWGRELLQRLGLWAERERHISCKAYHSHSLLYVGISTSLSSMRFNFIIYWIVILINRYFVELFLK